MELSKVKAIELKGKNIILTGGYGYLGREIALSLCAHGAKVIVAARTKDKFHSTFSGTDDKIVFEYLDISDENSIIACFQEVYSKYGNIDGLINNAFYLTGNSPENMTLDDFTNGLEGTLTSVYACIKHIIPYFKKSNGGKIVNVSSMYGIQAPEFEVYNDSPAFLNPPHYGAAKAGVAQLSRYYSSYLGQHNILVNTVVPGAFPSQAVQEDRKFIENLSKKTALGRIGMPEELAGIFTFLMSEAASYITGQNFIVDGGWTIK